eukprot:PhM_4_TR6750/c0_g1_i2/m.90688
MMSTSTGQTSQKKLSPAVRLLKLRTYDKLLVTRFSRYDNSVGRPIAFCAKAVEDIADALTRFDFKRQGPLSVDAWLHIMPYVSPRVAEKLLIVCGFTYMLVGESCKTLGPAMPPSFVPVYQDDVPINYFERLKALLPKPTMCHIAKYLEENLFTLDNMMESLRSMYGREAVVPLHTHDSPEHPVTEEVRAALTALIESKNSAKTDRSRARLLSKEFESYVMTYAAWLTPDTAKANGLASISYVYNASTVVLERGNRKKQQSGGRISGHAVKMLSPDDDDTSRSSSTSSRRSRDSSSTSTSVITTSSNADSKTDDE